jgi:hypothetical protein
VPVLTFAVPGAGATVGQLRLASPGGTVVPRCTIRRARATRFTGRSRRTERGIGAGTGRRSTGMLAIAGAGGQGRTCARVGCTSGVESRIVASSSSIALSVETARRSRGTGLVWIVIACLDWKTLAGGVCGLAVQRGGAGRATRTSFVAADAVGKDTRGALDGLGRFLCHKGLSPQLDRT